MVEQWFEIIEGDELRQGDVICGCPVYRADTLPSGGEMDVTIELRDLIVMTQSCDLQKGREKVRQVVFCNAPLLSSVKAQAGHVLANKNNREHLAKFALHGFHPLKAFQSKDVSRDWAVVEFSEVVTLPLPYVRQIAGGAGKRLRLVSPYRELLAQRFAHSFARIGIPDRLELPE